ncbi:unnamed protein product [Ilex paraguariensis]|uniref:Uncharacterized protein n=1 Tax=Ilex paraguariensis TaxID=185542 RepID=A0ABC8R3R7_9AQUA
MVEWVWNLYGMDKLLEVVDPKLTTDFDQQEIEHLMIVGLWCAHPDPTHWPSIRQAIDVLNFEAKLPILPSQMPVPTYSATSAHTSTFSQLLSYGNIEFESIQVQSSSYIYNTDSSRVTTSSVASSPSASLL